MEPKFLGRSDNKFKNFLKQVRLLPPGAFSPVFMHLTELYPDSLLRFRPIEASDEAMLLTVYASSRSEEMALLPDWTDTQKLGFLTQQFQAQHLYYQQNYPRAAFLVILCAGQVAGRLYLDRRPAEIRIVDITLLPAFRNQGFGVQILQNLQAEATAADKPLTIHVERQNRALQLYERLGFRPVETGNAVYLLMEWRTQA